MQAIVSDIHANQEAFEVVLRDIERQGVTEIISLGDFIGYGASPYYNINLTLDFKIILYGNHEDVVL